MFASDVEFVINEYTTNGISRMSLTDEIILAICVNPCYDWFQENCNISYKLLKGFVTNIVPLGDAGRNYFENIAEKKIGFTIELMSLYNRLEKEFIKGTLRIKSYLELQHLGYTGTILYENCPVDDVWEFIK
ncbi:hypothetical protein [Clostridium sp.]|uniref:hypothetical protein n=1 Tax=Clostridium sp. TaxID=1506 RepID=UPI001A3AD0A1|nr:hypothetical protein [Clostridium sp.]MBK5241692.1 hypothetical protein [Clostridium sp.]